MNPLTLAYVAIGFCAFSVLWQLVSSRSTALAQRALHESLLSLECRTAGLLASIRHLLRDQERRRILRDAREAQIRLNEGEDAATIIDIGRVNDGQAEGARLASERAATPWVHEGSDGRKP